MNAPGPFQDAPVIRIEKLTLVRGGRLLFEDLTFTVERGGYGEVRGANGAGKTSLLRAAAGYLRPQAGRIVIEGAEEAPLGLHYLAHLNGLKGAASVRAHLRYWAGLFGGAPSEDYVLRLLGLERAADAPARVLSQGQARRLALARLVIAPRPIWLLDEPAAALDAQGRDVLNELIGAHRAQGGLALAAVHEPLGPTPSHTVSLMAA